MLFFGGWDLKRETLTLTTKNWTVVYNFIGSHFQSDQNFSKQNIERQWYSLQNSNKHSPTKQIPIINFNTT